MDGFKTILFVSKARDNISRLSQANQVLWREVDEPSASPIGEYNHKRIHSTTHEIPFLRYQRALKENRNVFSQDTEFVRPFTVPPPYQSIKDIFCFRIDRRVDAYRSVSIKNLKLKFNNAPLYETVNLRIYPDEKSGLSEIGSWFKDKLLDVQKIKTDLLDIVHF
jgi:hypothetical protein